ncbi:borealin-like [Vespa velutina]|uniref:borealin-like n=1 Tax=Vespa crabro TaxID=7445 RepID=UPI001F000EBB|nr:borealin-like [Vespa crabro]XP_047367507.1 borealin-like [Vespa velutina]
MPRTKQTRKSKQNRESLEESDLFLKDFQKKLQLRINKLDNEAKFSIKSYETYHNVKLAGIPAELKQMTLGEIIAWKEDEKENCNEVTSSVNDQSLLYVIPSTVKAKKTSKRGTATSDDGYVTEGTTTGASTSRISRASRAKKLTSEAKPRRVTRSSSKNRQSALIDITHKALTKNNDKGYAYIESQLKSDKFKTPAPSKTAKNEYNLITPKVKPNTPMNVLRRPREGEMVLSMQGSPLLVSAIVPDKTANINVPLSNGNIMSLLPNDGLRMSHIPALDPETMRQLETLKDHIEKVISLK